MAVGKPGLHMKIAVNTRLLTDTRLEGLGVYTHEVVRRMVLQHPEDEFLFFFDRSYPKQYLYAENVKPVLCGPPARHPFLFMIWFHHVVKGLQKKHSPDVFFSPDGYLALNAPVPQVPVFHDLNFEHHPELFSRLNRWYYHRYFPQYAREATRICAISQFTAGDLVKTYGVDPGKIDVAYNGISDEVKPATKEEIAAFREKYRLVKPWFAFVGGLYPRKNLVNMLKAFERFKDETGAPHVFAIAGSRYAESEPLFDYHRAMRFRDDVMFLGRLPDRAEVNALLSGAAALMYVSLFEGFGLPIVEAMRSCCPVITGNITSMPEVAADAALCVSPGDPDEIAQAMKKLAFTQDLREELIQKGLRRAEDFNWNTTAEKVYETLVRAGGR